MKKIVLTYLSLFFVLSSFMVSSSNAQMIAVYMHPDKIDADGVHFDQGLIDVLEAEEYEVEIFYSASAQEYFDLMEEADLVILARAGSSGDHSGANKATFNSVETPIINLMPWGLRVANGNWFNSTECVKVLDESVMLAEILEPDDEVFNGVDVSSGELEWAQGPYDYLNVVEEGNGQVLAVDAATGTLQFVRFEAGVEFYDGSEAPAGPRTFMGNGDDSVGDNINTFNFVDGASLTVFLNEVARMSGRETVGNKYSKLEGLNVYYNASSKSLIIKNSSDIFDASIFDISGQIVKRVSNASQSINISELKTGIYIVSLRNNDKTYTQKINVN
jgi:hypothetical protein